MNVCVCVCVSVCARSYILCSCLLTSPKSSRSAMSCLIIDPYVRANTSAFICSNCGTPGAFGARNLGVFICSALPIGFIVCCLYYFVILYQLPHFTSIHPTRTHVHTHAHMHVRTNIHTLAHTHTLLHTHTHTRKPRKLFPYLF